MTQFLQFAYNSMVGIVVGNLIVKCLSVVEGWVYKKSQLDTRMGWKGSGLPMFQIQLGLHKAISLNMKESFALRNE